MNAYALLGVIDHEGETLLGVFDSIGHMMDCIERESAKRDFRAKTLGYDELVYVETHWGVINSTAPYHYIAHASV